MNAMHQCLFRGCTNPPTKAIDSDVGLEGGLMLYFCDEHEELFRSGKTEDFDVERTEADGNDAPES